MNETYEWLYDHYALPPMQVRDGADQIKQAILSHSDSGDRVFLGDQLDSLCMLWEPMPSPSACSWACA